MPECDWARYIPTGFFEGLQDASQLKLAYGREYADVVLNICGNLVSGQVVGETAKFVSDHFGRLPFEKESYSYSSTDTNVSRSTHLEEIVPASRIAALSSGEFVGVVADNPDQEIALKSFCCKVSNDHHQLKKEEDSYLPLPVVRKVTGEMIASIFIKTKANIADLVESELQRLMDDPNLQHLMME